MFTPSRIKCFVRLFVFLSVLLTTLCSSDQPGLMAAPFVDPVATLPPLQNIKQIAVGDSYTCALTTTGGVKCWGILLGTGNTKETPFPTDVSGLNSGISVISAGGEHSCALTMTGGVKCWGDNAFGQLGHQGASSSTPVDVGGLSSGVSAISAGGAHTCALLINGGVQCWGHNYAGQLGNGSINNSMLPKHVIGLSSGVRAISAGGGHTCALLISGGVQCWGYNNNGQLGNAGSVNASIPVDVSGLSSGVSAISAGAGHTCAVTTAGAVSCWGWNEMGQLGNGSSANSHIPMAVSGLSSGVSAIRAGWGHSCAITTVGGVKCWGWNVYAQLGKADSASSTIPVDVMDLASGISGIGAGWGHSCALTATGSVVCWGNNFYGQVGNGNKGGLSLAVDVIGLSSGVTAISAGAKHSCAVTQAGSANCWGYNSNGQLGNGNLSSSAFPTDVVGLNSGANAISTGEHYTCALTTAGGVKCWGDNFYGQLGNGSIESSTIPTDVIGLSQGIRAVRAGRSHSCALTIAGGVKCWGSNDGGQLGNGNIVSSTLPVDVIGLDNRVSDISIRGDHSCALTTASGVKCWGYGGNGQLGNGSIVSSAVPTDVIGLSSGVVAISTGDLHTCVVTTTGGVKCWGDNFFGQLGNGNTNFSALPVDVIGLSSGIRSISVGFVHTCALTTTGAAKCWGHNGSGQLGNGEMADISSYNTIPTDVSQLNSDVTLISAGESHTCAVTTTGSAKCWGSNEFGSLGDGSAAWRPTLVVRLPPVAYLPLLAR